ncbi:hypothetical protein [Moraxella catarrhalis]|uniref:hypothetical protein n=1 Tax=Moraxella catarrhalis TaxID=480 RepID=UPI0015F15A27|nr:hypothetical protein [Moraxella catarrhalis]
MWGALTVLMVMSRLVCYEDRFTKSAQASTTKKSAINSHKHITRQKAQSADAVMLSLLSIRQSAHRLVTVKMGDEV